ncbi:MAG: hypothetical protein HeimC2_10870 [Candidatus Heimdallarchaeota archaeon LC_2]|nr:MAG: hypothetical protein HeimC2_10870 [Candidatus Heimdallarchaeota archaeon LC_2]
MQSPINPNMVEENSIDYSYDETDGFTDMNPSEIVATKPTTESIETSAITTEIHSPGRDSYIIDFGFVQSYTFSSSQVVKDGFWSHLSFTETAVFTAELIIPVNLTLEYDTSATAGSEHSIIANLYPIPFGAGLTISYGFTLGGAYRVGPFGSLKQFELFNYTNAYVSPTLTTPMDPEPLTEFELPLPLYLIPAIGTVIDALFDISLVLTPQLDVDISADLYYEGDGFPSVSTLNFDSYEAQAFSIAIDDLSGVQNNVKFGLRNFTMDFFLSLLWSLRAQFSGLLSFLNFLGPLTVDLFTYPRIPLGGVLTSGDAYGTFAVTPSTNLPQFGLDTYELVGDVNGIAEPGESINLSADILNYGSGSSLETNITVTSSDVTILTGGLSTVNTPIAGSQIVNQITTFSIPGGYTERNITLIYDTSWQSPNGTIRSDLFSLTIRVLQTGEAFLNLDDYTLTEVNDGFWDAGESVTLNINLSKIGSANIDFGYIEVLDTDPQGFSSSQTWESVSGTFTTWNSTTIELTSPVDITQDRVDLLLWISYDLTTGETFNDFWVISYDIFPQQPYEDLFSITGTLFDGIDDGIFEAGENFTVTAELENLGTDNSGIVYGILVTNDTDVTIENSWLTWSDHTSGSGPVLSTNSILMSISPHAENQTMEMTLYLIYETWWGEVIVDEFTVTLDVVQHKDPLITLNYYDIYDVDTLLSSSLIAGETSFVTVNIGITEGPAYGAIGNLRTNNSEIVIANDTSVYGNLDPGMSSDGDGFVVYVPANFAGGTVRFYVNVTSYSAVGGIIFEEAYFDVVIAAGDIIDPTYSLVYPQIADNGSLQSMTVTIDDDINVANMYFAYFDYDLDDWEIFEVTWTGDVGGVDGFLDVTIDFQMDSSNFLFAFLLFDHAGNYVGSGLDTPNVVIVNFPITDVSTDSGGSSPASESTSNPSITSTSTPTDTSTKDDAKSTGDSSPILIIGILIGFSTILFVRKLKLW